MILARFRLVVAIDRQDVRAHALRAFEFTARYVDFAQIIDCAQVVWVLGAQCAMAHAARGLEQLLGLVKAR